MRTLALTVTLLLILGMTASAAQSTETIIVKAGQQRIARKSGLKIKFISVIEDSRCPVGVNCVWAGNAKIKVQITGEHGPKTFEFNTTMGPKGDILDGWSITIDSLTPQPRATKKPRPGEYRATFNIVRLSR
jgi:hypothetical protein